MAFATDFYDEDAYWAAVEGEGSRCATDAEAVAERAWVVGAEDTGRAWLLDPRDVWVANPHYRGPAVPHPEDDYDAGDVAAVVAAVDDEIPF